MKKTFATLLLLTGGCFAETILPEGTKIHVRLEQSISSATAEEGQHVELCVTDAVRVGDVVVIAEGAHVTGTIMQAHEKRRMGRAGRVDFSIDRVKAIDNQWIPLRYTVTRKSGQSHALSTGILAAGTAAVFWPAAPVFLLRKGQDVTINRDVAFDVYTDRNLTVNPAPDAVAAGQAGAFAAVSIVSSVPSAEIEVDGLYLGSAPTTVQLSSGPHVVIVRKGTRSWTRTLQLNAGNVITLNAVLQ
jgi:hypothetical protein